MKLNLKRKDVLAITAHVIMARDNARQVMMYEVRRTEHATPDAITSSAIQDFNHLAELVDKLEKELER